MLTTTGRTSALTGLAITHLGLASAYPGSAGTANELSAGSYARQAFTPTIAQPELSIPAAETFSVAEDVEWITGWTALTAGSCQGMVPMGGQSWEYIVVPTTEVVTIPGHDLVVDERVVFYHDVPTGLTAGTKYWVKTVSGDDITVSATQGGAAIDITAAPTNPENAVVSRIVAVTGASSVQIDTWVLRLG